MAHLRHRYLQALLEKTAKFSPVTGVFGHRQVGKTTLVSLLADNYLTLDDAAVLDQAMADPKSLLKHQKSSPLVIDECQYAPPLFPAIKEWIRTHPSPGQLLLTGSVRFSSRKAIRESLTGRMVAWELLPMNLSEVHHQPLPDTLLRLAKSKTVEVDLPASDYCTPLEYQHALERGGLPGVFAIREDGIRAQRFETQINTLLERDLRLILETTLSFRSLRNLLQVLAGYQNQPLELATISRQTRISVPTLRKLLAAFEAIFLIRIIPSRGETQNQQKKPVLFFEDQGEAWHLAATNTSDKLSQMTCFLFSQTRPQWVYRPEVNGSFFQYRTRGGAYVPLCYQDKNGILGLLPILDENPNENAMASARSFLKNFPTAKAIFIHSGSNDHVITSRIRTLGVAQLV